MDSENTYERPEFVRRKSQYSRPSFMHKGTGRVPWLNLLTEEKLHLCRVLFVDIWEYRIVESGEHFGGEGTDVVEVELDGYHIAKSEFSFVDNKT